MAKTKAQKKASLETIATILKKTPSAVFAGFNQLTVGEVTETRKAMLAKGVKMLVVKKTLLAKALTETSLGTAPALSGQVALVYGNEADVLAPAREVYAAGKKYADKLSILGGIFDGAYADQAKMTSLATIPSRETLIAQFVNLINSPIQRFVIALDAVAKTKSA